jgi:phosphatidylglycerophosphatase C
MNVYDFDKTIFDGDSTVLFVLYLLKKQPHIARAVPGILGNGLLFLARMLGKQAFKERLFVAVFTRVSDIDAHLHAFWDLNEGKIKRWYARTRREDDVVITASPVGIVRPMCERLGIRHVLGSPVDLYTGRYSGPNCHGEEKVLRFRAAFPGETVDDFYSDSHADDPMARIAKRAIWVRGEELSPWVMR